MEPVDVAADPEPPGHLPRLRSSVLPGPVPFTRPRRSARLRTQRDSDEAHPALVRQDCRARQQEASLSMSAALDTGEADPDQYQDAMTSENASEWTAATKREFDSLTKNVSWVLVPLPPNQSLIKSRWTFKLKPGSKTRPPTYKARLVAKGFSQVAGIDYNETEIYAPVVKHDSLRILLSIAAALDLELM